LLQYLKFVPCWISSHDPYYHFQRWKDNCWVMVGSNHTRQINEIYCNEDENHDEKKSNYLMYHQYKARIV